MGFEKRLRRRAYTACVCFACVLFQAGCNHSDIDLVRNGSLEGYDKPIGTAFDGSSQFVSTSWERIQYEVDTPVVVFMAELPVKPLLETVSEDSGNWFAPEKTYFREISGKLASAYLRITFPVSADRTFRLGEVMLGIVSKDSTAWSPSFPPEEKDRVIRSIYLGSPGLFSLVAPYANPSFPQGIALLHTLTGKGITAGR